MQSSSSLGDYRPCRVACIIILESSVNITQFSHILGILVSVAQGKFGALVTLVIKYIIFLVLTNIPWSNGVKTCLCCMVATGTLLFYLLCMAEFISTSRGYVKPCSVLLGYNFLAL